MTAFFKIRNLLAALVLFCFFSACSPPQITRELPQINEIVKGSKFVVILPEDHTKGYSWLLKNEYNKNAVSHDNTVWHGNDKGVYFHFQAHQEGLDTLIFICRKYRDTLDTKTYIVKITDH